MVNKEYLPLFVWAVIFVALANTVIGSTDSRVISFVVLLIMLAVFFYMLWRFVILPTLGFLLSPITNSSKWN